MKARQYDEARPILSRLPFCLLVSSCRGQELLCYIALSVHLYLLREERLSSYQIHYSHAWLLHQASILLLRNILNKNIRFCCVRYGNVLASRGSVIPLFHEQIKTGGPVTITVPSMTRFLLSINQAVDTIFETISNARPGETYVPIVPSATVENVAEALIGRRKVDIKIIGIRPGEKMHEILVSEEECHHVVRRGDYYVILPMLPELRDESEGEINALEKEFSSADTVLDLNSTIELLEKNDLMVKDATVEAGELLR